VFIQNDGLVHWFSPLVKFPPLGNAGLHFLGDASKIRMLSFAW
jgi:hypothetical protein